MNKLARFEKIEKQVEEIFTLNSYIKSLSETLRLDHSKTTQFEDSNRGSKASFMLHHVETNKERIEELFSLVTLLSKKVEKETEDIIDELLELQREEIENV